MKSFSPKSIHALRILMDALCCAALLLTVVGLSPANAASIVVNSNADDTLANLAGNSTCDLREAIEAANTDTAVGKCPAGSGADTITFDSSLSGATITLAATGDTTAGPSAFGIDSTITIEGNSAGVTINAAGSRRIFYVSPAGNLTLDTLTLSGGTAQGGNGGSGTYFASGGGGGGGLGGAIFNQGSLSVQDSTFSGNTAQGGAGGHAGLKNYSTAGGGGGGGGLGGAGGAGGSPSGGIGSGGGGGGTVGDGGAGVNLGNGGDGGSGGSG
ncbi:MAG TPA: CSLREA domain-containing protein, partial [Thermoanaerobaculia bacterium]|nr:CSLREA domain-containing protein [Thermoanaerobaculia bacterium]